MTRFEPCDDALFAIALAQGISGSVGGALGFPLEAGDHLSLFNGQGMTRQPDARLAHRLKRLAEACCCPLGGGGGVVQFMRQAR